MPEPGMFPPTRQAALERLGRTTPALREELRRGVRRYQAERWAENWTRRARPLFDDAS